MVFVEKTFIEPHSFWAAFSYDFTLHILYEYAIFAKGLIFI